MEISAKYYTYSLKETGQINIVLEADGVLIDITYPLGHAVCTVKIGDIDDTVIYDANSGWAYNDFHALEIAKKIYLAWNLDFHKKYSRQADLMRDIYNVVSQIEKHQQQIFDLYEQKIRKHDDLIELDNLLDNTIVFEEK